MGTGMGLQVFVANPNKPPAIANILRKNKEKLSVYLREFHKDRDDEQFNVSVRESYG